MVDNENGENTIILLKVSFLLLIVVGFEIVIRIFLFSDDIIGVVLCL